MAKKSLKKTITKHEATPNKHKPPDTKLQLL